MSILKKLHLQKRKEEKQDPNKEEKEKKPEKSEDKKQEKQVSKGKIIDTYTFDSRGIPLTITISKNPDHFVPLYEVSISSITKNTEIILENIRKELIEQVNLR